AEMPAGAVIATSSLRRQAMIRHRRPDLQLVNIRGNVETRLQKLQERGGPPLDGLILAHAGLQRLGLAGEITEVLDPSWMLPAVGQGALGLECRADDQGTRDLLSRIDHPPTHQAIRAERALLRELGGGCQIPIGALSTIDGTKLTLRAAVVAPDGSR